MTLFFNSWKLAASATRRKVTNHSERNTQPQSILMSESLSHSLYAYLSAWPRNIVITSQLGSLPPALPLLNTSSITTPVRASHCVSGHPTSLLQTFQQLTVHSIIQGTFLRVLYFRHHARVLVIQVGKKKTGLLFLWNSHSKGVRIKSYQIKAPMLSLTFRAHLCVFSPPVSLDTIFHAFSTQVHLKWEYLSSRFKVQGWGQMVSSKIYNH